MNPVYHRIPVESYESKKKIYHQIENLIPVNSYEYIRKFTLEMKI